MKLDEYLKSMGVTEKQLAEKINSTQATINRVRRGKSGNIKTLTKVCAATDWAVTLNDFAPDDEKGAPK